MSNFNENVVEQAALEYFAELGYRRLHGPDIAPGEPGTERSSYEDVILWGRLRAALTRINPGTDATLIDEAVKTIQRADSQSPIDENARLHQLITEDVPVEHRGDDGQLRTTSLGLVDFEEPSNNDWVAVNQFSIVENGKNRRPDVLVMVNGLPLALLELKNPAAEHATLKSAWNQVQTYRHDIPSVFVPNAVTVISDGTSAAMGRDWCAIRCQLGLGRQADGRVHDGLVLDGGQSAQASLSATTVVGPLDPGDDRDPQLFSSPPSLAV